MGASPLILRILPGNDRINSCSDGSDPLSPRRFKHKLFLLPPPLISVVLFSAPFLLPLEQGSVIFVASYRLPAKVLLCSEFLRQIRKITDELAFIGSPVSDDDLAVLNGLGLDYNSFIVAAATASRNDPLTFLPAAFYTRAPSPYGFNPRPNQIRNPRPNTSNQGPRPSFPFPPRPSFTPGSGSSLPPNQGPRPNKLKDSTITCQICSKQGHRVSSIYSSAVLFFPNSWWLDSILWRHQPRHQRFEQPLIFLRLHRVGFFTNQKLCWFTNSTHWSLLSLFLLSFSSLNRCSPCVNLF